MPVTSKGRKIVEKRTGRVVGTSKTPAMAKKAARTRNATTEGGFKPTRNRSSSKRRTGSRPRRR